MQVIRFAVTVYVNSDIADHIQTAKTHCTFYIYIYTGASQ